MNPRPLLLLSLLLSLPAGAQQAPACHYAAWKSGFHGNARAQATCLLRPVGRYARIGQASTLPAFLDRHVGEKVTLKRSVVLAYLVRQHIAESDLGGALEAPLSRAQGRPALRRPSMNGWPCCISPPACARDTG